jgi:ABC-type branched-subunit amino acid transport system permease subunit
LLPALSTLIVGLNPYLLTVLILMLIFIIYSSAWNFLTYTGQGSLGHAAFFGLGGYGSALIASWLSLPPFAAVFIGAGAAALAGLFIGAICVRLKEWFLAIVTSALPSSSRPGRKPSVLGHHRRLGRDRRCRLMPGGGGRTSCSNTMPSWLSGSW